MLLFSPMMRSCSPLTSSTYGASLLRTKSNLTPSPVPVSTGPTIITGDDVGDVRGIGCRGLW